MSIKDVIKALKDKKTTLDADAKTVSANAEKQLTAWQKLKANVGEPINGKVKLDTAQFQDASGKAVLAMLETAGIIEKGASGVLELENQPLMDAADAAIVELTELLKLINEGGGRKGGGGGKKKQDTSAADAARAAEEARRAQEEEWQKELDAQLRLLEQKKRLGEINTKEEIRQLEIIEANYAKTTDQKLAMEDKLFEARARLRDEEIAEVDKLNQGIITALRNRYDEQRKAEEERLAASSDAWQAWGDENVKAIQAQIDALDALVKSEDREAQEKAKRRKIEATRQMLEYTTDEANQASLRKELQRLNEDFATWQRNNAIADEKERLRTEQEAIRERVQTEQDAIDKLKDANSQMYDELTKDASLRAEAERMLATSSQKEILALIGSYAPDYEATGKTLGERLYNGLTQKLGDLTN